MINLNALYKKKLNHSSATIPTSQPEGKLFRANTYKQYTTPKTHLGVKFAKVVRHKSQGCTDIQ